MEQNPFQQATIAHANNDLIRAKKLYLQILKKDSQNVKVLFLVGTLYLQSKKPNEAIQFLKMAYSLNKKDPHILMNLGIAYKDKQEFTNAEKYLKASLDLAPNNPNIQNNLGNFLFDIKQYDKALHFFQLANQADPANRAFQINLADCLSAMSFHQKAIDILSKIPSQDEFFIATQEKLLNIFFKTKKYKECIILGQKLLGQSNNFNPIQLVFKMIQSYLALGNIPAAQAMLKLIKKNSQDQKFYQALIELEQANFEKSRSTFEELSSDRAYSHLCHLNLGILHFRMCNFRSAMRHYKIALKIKPDCSDAKIQLGLCQLSQCQFSDGWDNFYFYHSQNNFLQNILNKHKHWDGSGSHKKILIFFDQGVGDQIFFSALLNRLSEKNDYLCFVNEKLINIFQDSFSNKFKFLPHTAFLKMKDYDFYLNSTELGKLFIKNTSDLSRQGEYLLTSTTKAKKKSLIGISWFSKNELIGRKKSLNLDHLVAQLKHKTKLFINLQYGDFSAEISQVCKKHAVTFLNVNEIDNYSDIVELARLMLSCDEIFTISNTTAHLAGALGVKTNLLLPYNHQSNTWYWFSDTKNQSLWYPSVKVIEANRNQDLSKVLEKIR